jgi:hypothetical protein
MITATDAAQVDGALLAVEMNTPGACGQSDAVLVSDLVEVCLGRTTIFADDFESGVNDWTVSNSNPPTPYDWEQTGTPLPFGRGGVAWFCVDPNLGDCAGQDESAVHSLQSPTIVLSPGAAVPMLAFTHYLASEGGWDGGTVRVRVNSGSWQTIPRQAYQYNPYNGRLNTVGQGNTNPLSGEPAFTGAGGAWGTTVVDLSSLAAGGDTLEVRFDFGKDGCTGVTGWYVDDFEVFDCPDCDADTEPDFREFAFNAASDVLAPVGDESPQSFTIDAPPEAGSDVRITITGVGDFSAASELVDVDVNGVAVGSVFETGAGDCPSTPDREEFVVPAGVLNAAVAGGPAVINMVATAAVNPTICDGESYVAISVEYETNAADCNNDVIPDECQLAANDCNANALPDECDAIAGGDFDGDGDVDLDDHAAFVDCAAGPDTAPSPTLAECVEACQDAFDFNDDGDVDVGDFAEYQEAFTGSLP